MQFTAKKREQAMNFGLPLPTFLASWNSLQGSTKKLTLAQRVFIFRILSCRCFRKFSRMECALSFPTKFGRHWDAESKSMLAEKLPTTIFTKPKFSVIVA